jgi:hypothetical protein
VDAPRRHRQIDQLAADTLERVIDGIGDRGRRCNGATLADALQAEARIRGGRLHTNVWQMDMTLSLILPPFVFSRKTEPMCLWLDVPLLTLTDSYIIPLGNSGTVHTQYPCRPFHFVARREP